MSIPFVTTTLDTGNEFDQQDSSWEQEEMGGDQHITANQVAHQLLVNGRGEMPIKAKCPNLSPIREDDSSLVFPFTEEEYKKGIATLKNKKVAGIDDVLVEQLKNLGPRAHRWIHSMLNVCFTENRITKV